MRIFETESMGSKSVGLLVELGLYTKFNLYFGGHLCNYSVTQIMLSKIQNARKNGFLCSMFRVLTRYIKLLKIPKKYTQGHYFTF